MPVIPPAEESALVPAEITSAQIMERVAITGDLAALKPMERVAYYMRVCESLGLNPLTKPFNYLNLNGKLTLYPTRDATDQIRRNVGISILRLEYPTPPEGLLSVVAYGRSRDGREDSASGVVSIAGLKGEALANAMMKAETKAKRRLTLSLAGLGMVDESEVSSIPDAEPVEVDDHGNIAAAPKLADKIALRAASVTSPAESAVVTVTAVNVSPEPEEQAKSPVPEPESVPDEPTEAEPVPAEEPPAPYKEEVVHADVETESEGALTLEEFSGLVAGFDRQLVRIVAKETYPDAGRFSDLSPTQLGVLYAILLERTAAAAAGDEPAPIAQVMTAEESAKHSALCGAPSPFTEGATCDLEAGHHTYHRSGPNERW